MIVALPAIAAAFLMVFTTKEPERGATEDALKVGGALPFLRLALGCAERYPQEGYLSLDAKTKNVIAVSGDSSTSACLWKFVHSSNLKQGKWLVLFDIVPSV